MKKTQIPVYKCKSILRPRRPTYYIELHIFHKARHRKEILATEAQDISVYPVTHYEVYVFSLELILAEDVVKDSNNSCGSSTTADVDSNLLIL